MGDDNLHSYPFAEEFLRSRQQQEGVDLIFHNKCIHAVRAVTVECLSMRKLCYSNAAAVALQMQRYEDAYIYCVRAVEVIQVIDRHKWLTYADLSCLYNLFYRLLKKLRLTAI